MKHSNSFSLFLFCVLPLFISPPADASKYFEEVVRANDLHFEKRYAQSAKAYESLIDKGARNGYLYYNLANTYIRMGKTGPAVLNYIRARKLIPRDENLAANLKFAIQQTRDKIEPPSPGTLSALFLWSNDFNLRELIYLAMILNFIFWITLALWMYFRSSSLQLARNVLLGLLLFLFFSIGVKLKNESDSKLAVVLDERVEVKSGGAEDAITLFQLHEGALVTVTDKYEDWLEVRLNDEQKGWVPKNSVGT